MIFQLFWTFFKIGAFTFGGGYAMLPLIQSEVVARGWMQEADLINFIAVSESTPGPFAVNVSTYIGAELAGIPGALAATLGVILPSFVIILIVAKCFDRFRKSKFVSGCMVGLRAAVIGLIASALLSIGRAVLFPEGFDLTVLQSSAFWFSFSVFALIAFLAFKKKHPITLIAAAALLGIAAGYAGLLE